MDNKADTKIKAVFESIQYLLTAGAVMTLAVSIEKYKVLITPEYPVSSSIAAVVLFLSGISLSCWAGIHSIKSFLHEFHKIV